MDLENKVNKASLNEHQNKVNKASLNEHLENTVNKASLNELGKQWLTSLV